MNINDINQLMKIYRYIKIDIMLFSYLYINDKNIINIDLNSDRAISKKSIPLDLIQVYTAYEAKIVYDSLTDKK